MDTGIVRAKKSGWWRALAFLLLAAVLGSGGCQGGTARPAVDPAQLLLDVSAYPVGWELCESGKYLAGKASPNLTEGAEEVAFEAFCTADPEARSGERIYRFRSAGRAASKYGEFRWRQFPDFPGGWWTPEGLAYVSDVADQWYFGCTDQWFEGETVCGLAAQYDEYFVFFSATTIVDGQEVLSVEDLARMLQGIDRKMAGVR